MNFHQLEYVIAIAEENSFSKAAKKLYISQPSLSEYIMRLEKQLGVKLFDKFTSPLTLTFAGEIDIAIMHLPIQDSRIVYEPISIERVFLVAPPGQHTRSLIELEKRQKFDFICLKNEKFILIKPGHRIRFIADELFKRAQFEPNILIETRNIDTEYNLANAGMGFTLVPESVIRFFNTNNYKNYFLIDDINFILAVAYRKGDYITKACHEFIKITKEALVSKQGSVFAPLG
ncbi:LysR family transcriptional regulator [Clostridium ljungdahlii]|uniref:LysR family transcriptional regulator n=1 Tax=Clostridium ljungdahlii TaxID=1538 RepID=UPI00386865E1